jgi:hypothetical protein
MVTLLRYLSSFFVLHDLEELGEGIATLQRI